MKRTYILRKFLEKIENSEKILRKNLRFLEILRLSKKTVWGYYFCTVNCNFPIEIYIKLNASGKNPSPPPTTHRIMVNLSGPKKSHTFNENEIPSHKESVKILLNGEQQQQQQHQQTTTNGHHHQNGSANKQQQHTKEVIHFHKPLVRTSSNINPVSIVKQRKEKKKTSIRIKKKKQPSKRQLAN